MKQKVKHIVTEYELEYKVQQFIDNNSDIKIISIGYSARTDIQDQAGKLNLSYKPTYSVLIYYECP